MWRQSPGKTPSTEQKWLCRAAREAKERGQDAILDYGFGGYKGEILKPKLWTTVKMWRAGRIASYLGTVALKGLSEVTAPSDSW